jgi:hypothetical protein
MRRLLPFIFLLCACDNNNLSAGPDLSPAPDLMTLPDLRPAGGTCAATQACIEGCSTSGSCIPDCIGRLDSAAQSDFDALENCAMPACATTSLGGPAPPCASTGSKACQDCINQNCASQEAACLAH